MLFRFNCKRFMLNTNNHHAVINEQFSPRANAYLNSTVHAQGEDLDHMLTLVGQRPGAIALDMGCGAGHVTFRLAPLVSQVTACDLSESMLAVVAKEAKQRGLSNVLLEAGTAESLTGPSAAFDVVISRYSAHHWHNVSAGLAQMRRVLKPDGLAIFMDVVSPGVPLLDTWLQTLELLRDPSHVRDFSLAEWQTLLASAGFVVGPATKYRLRLEFATWIERMKTPAAHVTAIRSLQQHVSAEIAEYFAIEADGSFTVDTVLIPAQANVAGDQ